MLKLTLTRTSFHNPSELKKILTEFFFTYHLRFLIKLFICDLFILQVNSDCDISHNNCIPSGSNKSPSMTARPGTPPPPSPRPLGYYHYKYYVFNLKLLEHL